ncbi:TrbI/VirB10 family protein [Burkholderia cenocepacia]|uniref:TrbI/VirB10 family protein n=1 Tax=Burkholderia cenocepacia TaxID=95486 RepID=UPI000F59EEF4|nr:TrbI/VirB10 family protein [Burkholderia cenocepacia]
MSNDINVNENGVSSEGLPSVNDRDGTGASSVRGKVIGAGILALLLASVVGGGYYAAVKMGGIFTKHEPKTDQASQPATGKLRKFDLDSAPPLPASLAAAAAAASAPVAASAPADAKPVDVKPVGNAQAGQQGRPVHFASRYDSGILLDDSSGGTGVRVQPVSLATGGDASGTAGVDGNAGALGGSLGGGGLGGGGGALSGQLTATATPLALASKIANLSLTMPKTTPIPCGLRSAIDSGRAGQTSCVVVRDMLSADSKVVLVDRGSIVDLEYGPVTKQGQRTVALLGTRIRTPSGVVVNIDSLAGDSLGRSGAPGYVDNHWGARIGAAALLAIVQDGVSYATTRAQGNGSGTTIYQNSSQTTDQMASKILDSTINIPPTVLINQGDQISIELSRDLDFSRVYTLSPQ